MRYRLPIWMVALWQASLTTFPRPQRGACAGILLIGTCLCLMALFPLFLHACAPAPSCQAVHCRPGIYAPAK